MFSRIKKSGSGSGLFPFCLIAAQVFNVASEDKIITVKVRIKVFITKVCKKGKKGVDIPETV